ncbi:MAG: transcription-repair coupling factor [Clostridiales bacterium]|nr:transcription-repair coupling factor [Clostridiales bacterium]
MNIWSEALRGLKEFEDLVEAVELGRCPAAAGGLNPVHKAHIAAALSERTGRPLFVLCPDDLEARRMAADLSAFMGEEVPVLPYREFVFHTTDVASREWEHARISILSRMDRLRAVVASYDAVMIRTIPPKIMGRVAARIRPGDETGIDSLVDALIMAGYKRSAKVEGEGQVSVRGGIVDFYSPGAEGPYRIEFFGDEIDTIYLFDPISQRRTTQLESAGILPASETLPAHAPGGIAGLIRSMEELISKTKGSSDLNRTIAADIERLENEIIFPAADRYLDLIYPDFATAIDYIPEHAIVAVMDHGRIAERARSFLWQQNEDMKSLIESGKIHPKHARFTTDYDALNANLSLYPVIYLDTFIGARYPLSPLIITGFSVKQLPSYGGSIDTALSDIRHYIGRSFSLTVLCKNETSARNLSEILHNNGISATLDLGLRKLPEKGHCTVALGSVSAGFEYPAIRFAVITEGQIAAERFKSRKVRKKSSRERVRSYEDLTPGDYVVHEHHGIARFMGIVTMEVDDVKRDYIKLAFAGTDVLYVPATQLDLVSKYIGAGEDVKVKLNKLGGTEWQRSKSRAKSAARELARELIELYAERLRRPGFAFPPDNEWQKEFELGFEYDETDDQIQSVKEIKADMESSHPMDRLLCGDVGFGKTEVALRAAMKCILAGKQVAFLAPTTVLVQQHYTTATRRFSGFPIKIDILSRFRTPKQQKETIQGIKNGSIDMIIGTHRLLQKDVSFRDLGLLIVDEEQRFGVTHKERLKEISRTVDVLTLSATPIPRTLHMALSGIKDMSTLEEAPKDRHPVQTYVLEHDWNVILDAIRREIGRGGQVYYLHNRIESIEQTASRLSKDLEGVAIAVAHGRMGERELSDVMQRMAQGEIQVLVCTTIIETGIDIPNVNTLIVEDADRMGLSQLHQIRGRVGRSQRHAYAYLTFRRGKVLSEIAEKRLNAIREFAEFGAGFKIAMRDLEIRGAGNILGHAQSGHMINVGYDMYIKLLEEAVLEERGEKRTPAVECTADLLVDAGIPSSYIPDSGQRMDLYRRIALVRTDDDASDLIDELADRYGDIPKSVHALIRIAILRADAGQLGITEINQRNGHLNFVTSMPDIKVISLLCSDRRYKGRLFFSAGEKPYLSMRISRGEDVLREAELLVKALGEYSEEHRQNDK